MNVLTPAEQLSLAISITGKAFEGVYDKQGAPYMLHCLAVMSGVDQTDFERMAIAVMHDLVEDTEYTYADLADLGFSYRVVSGVRSVTHDDHDEPYMDYVRRAKKNPDGREVKKADLTHNMQPDRMKGTAPKDYARLEKYAKAYQELMS